MAPSDSMHPGDLRAQLTAVTQGRFEIERELGRGGMGAVFLARQLNLDRRVAIKVLFPHQSADSVLRERFLREARTQSRFDHPNIVPIFDVAEEGGLSYFVMAFIDGPTLRTELDREKQPSIPWVTRALKEIGEALAYAHRVGVIHRDIKPENILLDPASGRALGTDFGIARVAEAAANVTATFTRIGSPRYMAPEQAESAPDLDGRTDQYALGLIGYEMLAGKPAFDAANPAELLYQHKYVEAESLDLLRKDAPAALRAAIHRAIRKSRDERFPTMDGFLGALESATPARVPKPAAKSDQLLRWIVAGVGVVLVGLIAVLLTRPKPKPPVMKPVEPTVRVEQDTTASVPTRSRGGRIPTARFNGPASVRVADGAAFDASSSDDPEDGSYGLEVRWDFDQDGRFDTPWSGQKQTSYRYTRPGSYSVLLEVRDSGGQVDRSTRSITVEEVAAAPTAVVEAIPSHGPRGTSFKLDASRSTDDYDRPEDLEARWDFDADGSFDTEWSREKAITHGFDEFGAHRVRVEVRDREGRVSTAMQTVTVDAPTDPNELIGMLLAAFRTSVEREDFLSLGREVYQGEVPAEDRDLLKRIFDKAEKVTLDPPSPSLGIGRAEETMEARCRLRFRLAASGEPGDLKLRLTFGHSAGRADWKLRRIERD